MNAHEYTELLAKVKTEIDSRILEYSLKQDVEAGNKRQDEAIDMPYRVTQHPQQNKVIASPSRPYPFQIIVTHNTEPKEIKVRHGAFVWFDDDGERQFAATNENNTESAYTLYDINTYAVGEIDIYARLDRSSTPVATLATEALSDDPDHISIRIGKVTAGGGIHQYIHDHIILGGSGDAFPWEKLAFGYALSIAADNPAKWLCTINPGTVRMHRLREIALVEGSNDDEDGRDDQVELSAAEEWVHLEINHTFGSVVVKTSSRKPDSTATALRLPLFTFSKTESGGYKLEKIHHMGDFDFDTPIR